MTLADPALTGAVTWIEATLLGSIALVVAVMAVAVFGMLMLAGHIDWRRGTRIILGCFILFGAPAIAAGILAGAQLGRDDGSRDAMMGPGSAPPHYTPPSATGTVCWTCGAD